MAWKYECEECGGTVRAQSEDELKKNCISIRESSMMENLSLMKCCRKEWSESEHGQTR